MKDENQVNNTAAQLSQAIEGLTDNIANNEKAAIIQATEEMFKTKLQSKLSNARNEAFTEIGSSLIAIANAHQESVSQHLSEKVLQSEQNSIVSEPIHLNWSVDPINLDKQIAASREEQNNMRLIASEDEVNSWIEG